MESKGKQHVESLSARLPPHGQGREIAEYKAQVFYQIEGAFYHSVYNSHVGSNIDLDLYYLYKVVDSGELKPVEAVGTEETKLGKTVESNVGVDIGKLVVDTEV